MVSGYVRHCAESLQHFLERPLIEKGSELDLNLHLVRTDGHPTSRASCSGPRPAEHAGGRLEWQLPISNGVPCVLSEKRLIGHRTSTSNSVGKGRATRSCGPDVGRLHPTYGYVTRETPERSYILL